MFIGVTLLLIGILMLLDKMGIIHGEVGDYIFPVAVIAIGISFIFKNRRIKS